VPLGRDYISLNYCDWSGMWTFTTSVLQRMCHIQLVCLCDLIIREINTIIHEINTI